MCRCAVVPLNYNIILLSLHARYLLANPVYSRLPTILALVVADVHEMARDAATVGIWNYADARFLNAIILERNQHRTNSMQLRSGRNSMQVVAEKVGQLTRDS